MLILYIFWQFLTPFFYFFVRNPGEAGGAQSSVVLQKRLLGRSFLINQISLAPPPQKLIVLQKQRKRIVSWETATFTSLNIDWNYQSVAREDNVQSWQHWHDPTYP